MTNYFDGDYFDGDYFDTPTGASAQTITPTGVESAETFGSATLTGGAAQQSVTPTSITSTGAVGTPQINQHNHRTCTVQEYTGANLTKHGIIIERGGSGAFDENLVESSSLLLCSTAVLNF